MTTTDPLIGAPPPIDGDNATLAPDAGIRKWLSGKEYLYPPAPLGGGQGPESILDPLPIDRGIKADAWDAFHAAETPGDFQKTFDALQIPREAKADLFDLKFAIPQGKTGPIGQHAVGAVLPATGTTGPVGLSAEAKPAPAPPAPSSQVTPEQIRAANARLVANPPSPEFSPLSNIVPRGAAPAASLHAPELPPELKGGPTDPRWQGPRLPGKEPSPADFAAEQFSHPVRTGVQAALGLDPTGILSGTAKAAEGAYRAAAPASTMRERARGASDMIRGGMEAAEMLIPEQLLVNPLGTAKILGTAILAGQGTQAGLKHLGVAPEYADLAGDIASIVAGYGAHWATAPPEIKAMVAAAQQAGPNGDPAVDAAMIDKLTRMAYQHEQSPHEAGVARSMLLRKYGINIPEPAVGAPAEHVPMTAEAEGEAGPAKPAKPKPVVNADAFTKAHGLWHKTTTDAAAKFMEENPGTSWDDAMGAVEGTTGIEPQITDYQALPAPPEPPPPPKPEKPEPPQKVAKVGPGTQNPPTAALPTEPESPETIALQLRQLAEGTRKVVMFPGGVGQPTTFPPNVRLTNDGLHTGNTYAYREDMTDAGAIRHAAHSNGLPELLGHSEMGMGAPDKTQLQGEPIAVSANAPDGTEAQTTVTDAQSLPQTIAAAHAVTPPGGTVEIKPPEQVLADRAGEPAPAPAPAPAPIMGAPTPLGPVPESHGDAPAAVIQSDAPAPVLGEPKPLGPVPSVVSPPLPAVEGTSATAPTGMGAATNKSVSDLPVRATVRDGKIDVTVRYQRKTVASFSFPVNEWTATEAHPNPNYPQRQMAVAKLAGTNIADVIENASYSNERMNENVVDRLADSVAGAVREAVKKGAESASANVANRPAIEPAPAGQASAGAVPPVSEGHGQEPVRGLSGEISGESLPGDPERNGGREGKSVRRVTGSADLPLTPEGENQVERLADRAVEPFDAVLHAANTRSRETAAEFEHGEHYELPSLDGWARGQYEGQPAHDVKAEMGWLIANPDVVPSGVSPISGQPGQSWNQMAGPMLRDISELSDGMQPHQRVLVVTSGGNLQVIDAWGKAGYPQDLEFDRSALEVQPYWSVTGRMFRLGTHGLEEVTDNAEPGIYLIEHGETEWNQKPAPDDMSEKGVTSEREAEPKGTEAEVTGRDAVRVPDYGALENQLPETGEGTGEPGITFSGRAEGSGQGGNGSVAVPGEGDGVPPGVRTSGSGVGDSPERLVEEVTASNDEGQTVVERKHPPKDPAVVGTNHARDYRIPDGRVISGDPARRAAINIKVLKLLETLARENRPATVDEQHVLAGYVGWGGAKQLFTEKPEFAEMQADVKRLMTPEEYEEARASTVNAHYTGDQIVDSIWQALRHFGAKPGMSWLEPAMGTGNLFGRQPEDLLEGARRIGIEKDGITARIAKHLYPDSGVDNMPFERAELPDNYFDFAASNVPFGNYPVFDPKFRKQPYLTGSIHNYFFARSLDLVRPGGVVAFITSRYTMDAYDKPGQSFRRYIAGKADLIGAIRLPAGAFKQAANTDVITDIIFLRKRADGEAPQGESWADATHKNFRDMYGRNYAHPVNEYYDAHPEMVLGEQTLQRGEFTDHDYNVKGQVNAEILKDAIKRLPADQFREWEGPRQTRRSIALREIKGVDTGGKVGAFFFDKDGNLFRKTGLGAAEPVTDASALTKSRIKGQLHIRDINTALNAAERSGADDSTLSELRRLLNDAYDDFVKRHGFLSSRENARAMYGDPDAPLMPGLERKYNQGNKKEGKPPSAEKAPIFTKRLFGKTEIAEPKDAKEALSVTLNSRGFLDWDYLKNLTGQTDEGLMQELGGIVYRDPETQQYETADEYLSGSVRTKLRAARAHARLDPAYEANVRALEAAQPEDVPPSRIKAMLGVTWVPLQVYSQFVRETLNLSYTPNIAHFGNEWSIGVDRHGTTKWDTKRIPAGRLIDAAFNLRRVKVYDRDDDGKPVINRDETLAASQRQKEINEHFEKWLFADPERGDAMVRIYNDLQNDLRLRAFNGAHLTLLGMSRTALRTGELEPYQSAAVWRQIVQRNVLLNHAPGAGKTYEMIAAGMELKRLGLIQRPMYVVPNSTLGGWQDQFASLYPQARVLVFSETDLVKDKRRAAVARMATGDWDAVVVPHSSFQFIPVGDDIFQSHYGKLEKELTESIMEAEDAGLDTRMVTRLEKAKERLLTGLQTRRNASKQDNVISWEQLGIDQLFIDESHEFKKLGFSTKQSGIAGIDQAGNQKTFDLRMKVGYTQNHGRGVVFASGTPVTNTMGEIHSIMRYLIEPELEARGIARFDDWAAEFGRIVDTFERKPEGGGYQMKARFAKFVNLPRLATLLRSFTDVMTSDMLDIPRPKLAGGARRAVVTHMTPAQEHFQEHLQQRAKSIRSTPRKALPDGMLVVFGDGGKMAMDIRLVDPTGKDDPEGRISKVAENVYRFWKESAGVKGTQLIFSDIGVPQDARSGRKQQQGKGPGPGSRTDFSVYDELIRKLIDMGIPANEIAHIGEAKNKQQRKQIFERVDDGDLRVLIGSSQKMGIGVNMQSKGYALHHVDVPARPDILDQREARFIRQGNLNPEVHIIYYTTKGTLDENKFGQVVRKGKFIDSLWKGDFSQEEAEDISEGLPSWEMFQALTSGDPRILRKLEVDTEVDRLSRLQWAFQDQMYGFRRKLAQAQEEIDRLSARIGYLTTAKEARDKTGRKWVVDGKAFAGEGISEDVGKALIEAAQKNTGTIGTAHGLDIVTTRDETGKITNVSITHGPVLIGREELTRWILTPGELKQNIAVNKTHFDVDPKKWQKLRTEPDLPSTLVTRLENDIRGIDNAIGVAEHVKNKNEKEVENISKDTDQVWPYQEEYDKVVREQQQLLKDLGLLKDDESALVMEDGEEIADDSVAAEAPEASFEDDGNEEADDNTEGDSGKTATQKPAKYGKGAGPMSEYQPQNQDIPAPENGWYTEAEAGETYYSNGHFAIRGTAPTSETRQAPVAQYIKPPVNGEDSPPLAFAMSTGKKDAPATRMVIFSRESAVNADYYDYVMARFPNAKTLIGDNKTLIVFEDNGKVVAVIMTLRPDTIPANVKPLLPVPQKAPTPSFGAPQPIM